MEELAKKSLTISKKYDIIKIYCNNETYKLEVKYHGSKLPDLQ